MRDKIFNKFVISPKGKSLFVASFRDAVIKVVNKKVIQRVPKQSGVDVQLNASREFNEVVYFKFYSSSFQHSSQSAGSSSESIMLKYGSSSGSKSASVSPCCVLTSSRDFSKTFLDSFTLLMTPWIALASS